MNKLCVVSTKNPNNVLIDTITKIKLFYPDFDIVIIDSDSNNVEKFKFVPDDVKVHFKKNKNWELGAWYYSFINYDKYDIYMFLQDSTIPEIPMNFEYDKIIDCDYFYSFHYNCALKDGGYLDNLKNIYKNTTLQFISDMDRNTRIIGAAHSSFIANAKLTKKILELEKIYIDKGLSKTKIDSWLSERTIGIMATKYAKKRINIGNYFVKRNLKRDYP